ncbi:MAG: hypothetical protein HYU36_15205 [Planctomycetes bacterium]|nr:hypothetical protein [Planctomycetota bacterium]
MNHRDRQLAAIRHEQTDRISVDAISIEIADPIAKHLGMPDNQVLERLGLDGRIVSAGYTGPLPPPGPAGPYNPWGTLNTGEYGGAQVRPLAGAETVREIEHFAWPDPADYDYTAAGQRAEMLSQSHATRGPYWHPLFCRVCDLFGMEQALMHLASQPTLFEAAMCRIAHHVYEYSRRLLESCGESLDIFCLGDDFATQRGLMMSPDHWRRFIKPHLARLFSLGKQHGKFIWFHSCGDVSAVLGDFIDMGVDVWETVQLHTLPITPRELKRNFGRHLAFFGGINTQRLPFRTPEEVRVEVQQCIRVLGRKGGYICGPDHHIKPDVAPEQALALFDAATSFRAPGYTLAPKPS